MIKSYQFFHTAMNVVLTGTQGQAYLLLLLYTHEDFMA